MNGKTVVNLFKLYHNIQSLSTPHARICLKSHVNEQNTVFHILELRRDSDTNDTGAATKKSTIEKDLMLQPRSEALRTLPGARDRSHLEIAMPAPSKVFCRNNTGASTQRHPQITSSLRAFLYVVQSAFETLQPHASSGYAVRSAQLSQAEDSN